MRSSLIAAAASLVVTLAPFVAQAASPRPALHEEAAPQGGATLFEGVVAFGDSLSDAGNVFLATGAFEVRPFEAIPDAPYLIGGFRFSNGPTWIEWLTRALGVRHSGRPALLVPGHFTNYAVGGARARPDPGGIGLEIEQFLGDFAGAAPPGMLYVLWIGGNDLRDALENPAEAADILAEALAATIAGIRRLHLAGARSFLVPNLPNVAISPAIRALGAKAQQVARDASVQYNAALEASLSALEADLGITIARLDAFAFLDELADDPESFGLLNVADSCITPGVIAGAVCRHPNTYLFWDAIHPTTRAHRLVSLEAAAVLAATFSNLASVGGTVEARAGAR